MSPLAKAYAGFVGENAAPGATRRLNPESQGAFVVSVRREGAAAILNYHVNRGADAGRLAASATPPLPPWVA